MNEYDKIADENMKNMIRSGWYDKNKHKYLPLNIDEDETNWKNVFIVCFLIVILVGGSIGGFFYFVNKGKFQSIIDNVITCPDVPDCNLDCPNVNCPEQSCECNFPNSLNVNLKNWSS